MGCVPPIGHRRILPTIVDAAVAITAHVAGGGGAPTLQLLLPTATLLYLAAAHVGDVATTQSNSGVGDVTPPPIPTAPGAFPSHLPLPYVPIHASAEGGMQPLVHLIGRVVSRRRMARLLVFAHIVPTGPGSDAVCCKQLMHTICTFFLLYTYYYILYMLCILYYYILYIETILMYLVFQGRGWQAWHSPQTGAACEVQLIIGRSLVRVMGEDAADDAMRKVKVRMWGLAGAGVWWVRCMTHSPCSRMFLLPPCPYFPLILCFTMALRAGWHGGEGGGKAAGAPHPPSRPAGVRSLTTCCTR